MDDSRNPLLPFPSSLREAAEEDWDGSGLAHLPGFAGVDEAGRGCLAGPVVAAAVLLPADAARLACAARALEGLNDSKRLSAARRERLFPLIRENARAWGLGLAWMEEIDALNILRASLLAMSRALRVCLAAAGEAKGAAIDGNAAIPSVWLPSRALVQRTVVGGDGKIAAIAAASILAKQFRDRLMTVLDRRYPGYGFGRHKGYGTRAHREAIGRLGLCRLHRRSFAPCSGREARGKLC